MMFIVYMSETVSGAVCPDCDREFESEGGMKTHYGIAHGRPLPWRTETCETCGEDFTPRPQNYGHRFCSRECYREVMVNHVPRYGISTSGYPIVTADGVRTYIHHLVAISEGADPHKVFGDNEWDVDHESGCKLDNRPENLQPITNEDHGRKDGRVNSKYTHTEMLQVVEFFLHPNRFS